MVHIPRDYKNGIPNPVADNTGASIVAATPEPKLAPVDVAAGPSGSDIPKLNGPDRFLANNGAVNPDLVGDLNDKFVDNKPKGTPGDINLVKTRFRGLGLDNA